MLLWPHRNVVGKTWARQGYRASLRSRSHSDRNGPKQGCFKLTEKAEKRGPWRQVQGLTQDKLLLLAAPLVASLMGKLGVHEKENKSTCSREGGAQVCSKEEV